MSDAFTPGNALEDTLMRAANDAAVRPEFYRLLTDSTLFVLTPEPPRQTGKTVLETGAKVQLINWTDREGRPFIPLFTSLERLREVTSRETVVYGYLGVPAKDLMEGLARGPTRAILNPGCDYGKELTVDEMARLGAGTFFEPVKRVVVEKAHSVMVGQPKEYPHELVRALTQLFTKKDEVEAAYLAHYFDPTSSDAPHTMVALQLAGQDRSAVDEAGVVAGSVSKKEDIVDFMVLEGRKGIEEYFLSSAPFYKKRAGDVGKSQKSGFLEALWSRRK